MNTRLVCIQPQVVNKQIKEKILELTLKVGPEKTICPSEVARILWPDDWRDHMEEVRQVAIDLQAAGKIVICQKGVPVTDLQFKGPIRLRTTFVQVRGSTGLI